MERLTQYSSSAERGFLKRLFLFSPDDSRSFGRKALDKAFLGVSFVTLPLGVLTAGTSVIAGELTRAALAGGAAFLDFTQIRQHGLNPREQSWYNPERIIDKIWGSKRFGYSSRSLTLAAA